jgi:catechol 2,3-dioxygenase
MLQDLNPAESEPTLQTCGPIHPATRIGHVHLKVSDLDRSLRFYCGVLGFEMTQRFDARTAFVSTGGYHHLIGLNTRDSLGGSAPAPSSTGLYHIAILYPTRATLADALRRLMNANVPVDGVIHHGVSEAVYVRDPDGIALELCWDLPKDQWPRTANGDLNATAEPLNPSELLKGVNSSR